MTILEILLILIVVFAILIYIRKTRKHKHLWIYMFSGGDSNMFNWFYCPDCMAQGVAQINKDGKVEIQVYEVKKPWRKK